MARYDVENSIYNPILDDNVKDFLEKDNIDTIETNGTGIVLSGFVNRPDKFAEYYLGDSNYAWAVSALNCLTNGIEDYYLGRKLNLPKVSTLW
jgi:hypothetical protein